MYERPKAFTPEDRVLRWVATWVPRFQHGIPTDRFVRHLKGDLTGINFAQLEGALRNLEGQGAIRREWDTPGEYRVFLTEAGALRARTLEDRAARARAPPTVAFNPPPAAAAPAAAPFTPPPAPPPPPPPPATEAPPMPPPPAVEATVTPSPPAAEATESPPAPAAGAPIPSSGTATPPASANLPVRVLLYCLLYGGGEPSEALVPAEDLVHYLMNQGILLPDDYLRRLFDGLEKRGLLDYAPRPAGGYDLRLTPRGRHLGEGLLSGHVAMGKGPAASSASAPAPGPAPEGSPPAPPPDPAGADAGAVSATVGPGPENAPSPSDENELEDRWSAAEAENVELKRQVEQLRQALAESEEKRGLDRQTLDEVLHQMEMQDAQITELQAKLPGSGTEERKAPTSDAPP